MASSDERRICISTTCNPSANQREDHRSKSKSRGFSAPWSRLRVIISIKLARVERRNLRSEDSKDIPVGFHLAARGRCGSCESHVMSRARVASLSRITPHQNSANLEFAYRRFVSDSGIQPHISFLSFPGDLKGVRASFLLYVCGGAISVVGRR